MKRRTKLVVIVACSMYALTLLADELTGAGAPSVTPGTASDIAKVFSDFGINISPSTVIETVTALFLVARYGRKYIFKNPSKIATVLSHVAGELPTPVVTVAAPQPPKTP